MNFPFTPDGDAGPPAAPKSPPPLTLAQLEFARVLGQVLAATWDAHPQSQVRATSSIEKPPAKKISRRSKEA
jgi:hypothetical protein